MNRYAKLLKTGIIDENPVLVQVLGMCPTLAVTTSATNGLAMGLATMVVIAVSSLIISCIRKAIPAKIRIPAYIVVIATLVTIVGMIMQGYLPSLYESLGLYIPLIVVNCIVLGRAEAFASKNSPFPSFVDGIGMGLGFTLALVILGAVREILGSGSVFGLQILSDSFYQPITLFVLAPGAFLVLGFIFAVNNAIKQRAERE